MAIVSSQKHSYETFWGTFSGETWVKKFDDGAFGVRFNGKYVSNLTIFGYTREYTYVVTSKQRFSSAAEAEVYLDSITEDEITRAMRKAPTSTLWNGTTIDDAFVVFR